MGYSLPDDVGLRGDVHLRSGHAPVGPHEVAIDASSAEKHDIALGSHIKVLFRGPTQTFTVVGTVGYGGEKDLGGTTSAYFDTATAQRVLGTPGIFDEIDVRAADGVSDERSPKRLDAVAARRRRGRHRRDGGAGGLRRDQRRVQVPQRPVRRLRRHRAVRRARSSSGTPSR